MRTGPVVVVGAAARDLIISIDQLPEPGGSAAVRESAERLGGKGANIAAATRQLLPHSSVSLVAALGADAAGDQAVADALDAGIDVTHVARRGTTSLLVDVVEDGGRRRLLERIALESRVTRRDVRDAEAVIGAAQVVVLQLQQDAMVLVDAARVAHEAGATLVLDGAIESDEARPQLLEMASVVRADAHEAALLTGRAIASVDDAQGAASTLLAAGAELVALSVPRAGDLVAWKSGSRFYPHHEGEVIDPTGAGDAFVAGMVAGVVHNEDPATIGARAAAAAATAVGQLGGFTRFRPRR